MAKIYRNLSSVQMAAIEEILSDFEDGSPSVPRPSFKEYERAQDLLVRSGEFEKKKPKVSDIQNVTDGYEAGEVKLLPNFNAEKDMPKGWCVFPKYDSGGNFGIENAAINKWRSIWNRWGQSVCHDVDTNTFYIRVAEGPVTVSIADRVFPSNKTLWSGAFECKNKFKDSRKGLPQDTLFFDSYTSAMNASADLVF